MTLLVSSLLENHYSIICFLFFSFFGEKKNEGDMEKWNYSLILANQIKKVNFSLSDPTSIEFRFI